MLLEFRLKLVDTFLYMKRQILSSLTRKMIPELSLITFFIDEITSPLDKT